MTTDTPDPDATPTGSGAHMPAGGERSPWAPPSPYAHGPQPDPAPQPSGGQLPGVQYPGGPYAGGQYPGGQYSGGRYPGGPYPVPQYGGPHGGAPSGWPPPPRGRPPARRGLGGLIAAAAVAAVLAGAAGGAVGYSLANRAGGSSGVLGEPVPGVDEAAAPLGPVEAVAQRVLPSVVQLRVEGSGKAGEGSGMVLSPDGLVLTNNHVVEVAANGGTVVAVFQDGSSAPAQIVGRDPSSDLAVIRAQNVSGLTPVELGNSDSVRVGQQVVAFGSPLGLGGTVTTGIISAVDRAVSVGGDENPAAPTAGTVLNALQTDAAINPGNSGGPLVDMQGRVVGINSAIATTGAQSGSIGVGFSIPVNEARRTAQELEKTGKATHAVLGVNVRSGPGVVELGGAVVGPVVPGGPADKAGIREGQVITRVGDRIITNGNELVAAIHERAPGELVTLIVDGNEVAATLSGATG